MDLKEIGFYTLSDERVLNTSGTSQMKRCEMIITEYCNFKCTYCRGLKNEIYGQRKIKELSIEEIKRNIDLWCLNTPLENIRFSGGEPTLHKNIVEIIVYAKRKKINRIAISTNGSNKIELYKQLINAGCNDFSISLDACCADDGDKMSGGINGSWEKVVKNIEIISKLTYVTVGVVLTPENIDKTIDTIRFSHNLGVADIRIISAAQWNKPIPRLNEVEAEIKEAHPILKYRIKHFAESRNVRGMLETDSKKCALVLDDSVIAGDFHFPCIIYMRERGDPISKVSKNMRNERMEWFKAHDCFKDEICKNNCLDVCIDYNNKYRDLH
ncbi:MAG: radical SAM protein [Candidatus Omnitrophica bacterium]|nr:radical SAM protein [Candidatus Omnitrophota bacterium]